MADTEANEKQPPDTSVVSTPDSTTAGANGQKAAKDRTCPFCGQAFTSSSLGRHLDLYIKPRNPKPPDGVHDVNEIKKLRGSITRRQPRASLKASSSSKDEGGARRDSSGWGCSSAHKSTKIDARYIDGSPTSSPVATDEGLHTWLNAPNWQATGVINNLPARARSRNEDGATSGQAQRVQEMRRDAAGNRMQRPEYETENTWKLQEAAEVGRAAELALREVLGSLEAANKKVAPGKVLFNDFDFCSLSFPGLCLAILPPPPTLFSTTPFPSAHTWALSPPGEKQYEAMNRLLNEKVATVRNGKRENVPESVVFRHHVHVAGAWEHWQLMAESDKAAAWNLEIARAFVREGDRKKELRAELDNAQQHIQHLEAEYDRLSRCQLPREYLLHPPNTMPISPALMKEMRSSKLNSGAHEIDYNADALINKWKAAVKATDRASKPPSAQPPFSEPMYAQPRRNQLRQDMIMQGSVFGVNGPMARAEDIHGSRRRHEEKSSVVTYETPQQPGAVIEADEDEGEGDVDAEEEAGAFGTYVNRGASSKFRGGAEQQSASQSPYASPVNGAMNANGKRPLAPSSTNGRGSGPKIFREQHSGS